MIARTAGNPVDRVSVYIAAGLISGCGALMFNVMPVFVGGLSRSFGYDEARLGDMVALFNLGFTIASITAAFWVRRFGWRLLAALGVAMAAAGLAVMAAATGFAALAALMVVVGLAMGGLYALTLAILGDSDNPDRAFGLKLGLETLPGALLLFLLPAYVLPRYGFAGVALAMALVILVLGAFFFNLPSAGVKSPAAAGEGGSRRWLMLPALGLASSLLFFMGIASSWAFLELIAQDRGLDGDVVGLVLSVGFLICGAGGFVAAALGERLGPRVPMIGVILVNLAGLWFLSWFTGPVGYAAGSFLFLFSVNFTLAYTFGLTAKVDREGRLVVLSATCLSLGAVVGPAISGRLIAAEGYDMMLAFSAACSLAALGCYLLLDRLRRAD